MKYTSLIAPILAAVALTSCSEVEVPQQLTELQGRVKSAREELIQLDSAAVWAEFDVVRGYYEELKNAEFDSTLKEVYISDLTWLNRYERALSKLTSRKSALMMELDKSTEQVSNLIHDARKSILDSGQVNAFVQDERLAIQPAIDFVLNRAGEIRFYANDVDSMKTRLDSIFNNR